MEITLNGVKLSLDSRSNVSDALKTAKINPETVLVKRRGILIAHDEFLANGDKLELISVISGG